MRNQTIHRYALWVNREFVNIPLNFTLQEIKINYPGIKRSWNTVAKSLNARATVQILKIRTLFCSKCNSKQLMEVPFEILVYYGCNITNKRMPFKKIVGWSKSESKVIKNKNLYPVYLSHEQSKASDWNKLKLLETH